MRNIKSIRIPEHVFDFSDEDTDVVIVDELPEFGDEEPTKPMVEISMAQLVGMAPCGPDRPTRDLKIEHALARRPIDPAAPSDGVPRYVLRERTQPYASAYRGRVVLQLGGLE